MKISTKGRYALRVMIDLAMSNTEEFISLKDIASRQEISMKYLELIVAMLNKANLVDSQRGKKGGYKLARETKDYTIGEILKLTEGSMTPVSCVECGSKICDRVENCVSYPLWSELDNLINNYLEGVTLKDLIEGRVKLENHS